VTIRHFEYQKLLCVFFAWSKLTNVLVDRPMPTICIYFNYAACITIVQYVAIVSIFYCAIQVFKKHLKTFLFNTAWLTVVQRLCCSACRRCINMISISINILIIYCIVVNNIKIDIDVLQCMKDVSKCLCVLLLFTWLGGVTVLTLD